MWDRAQQALMESTSRLLSQFASFLPGIVALIVALFISALAAWIIGAGLRRFLAGIHFDERASRWEEPHPWSGRPAKARRCC